MKVIVGDVLLNTDNCSVLDTKSFIDFEPRKHRHVLRDGSVPICDFPSKEALQRAMEEIQNAERKNARWVELDPVDGQSINCWY